MMKIFAEHYAPAGIRINGVAPGWIETSMNDTLPADENSAKPQWHWKRSSPSAAKRGFTRSARSAPARC